MSEEKIIDRIKKLLSLSKSDNENEAAQAAAQAAELILKHEIEEAKLADDSGDGGVLEDVEQESIDTTRQIVHWKGMLASGLARSMGCRMYYGNRYDSGKRQRTYMVVGQPSKVATIRYMYSYLCSDIERLVDFAYREEVLECRKSEVEAPSARSWKNAFRLGAATTIYNRLVEQRQETHKAAAKVEADCTALAVVKTAEEAVEVFVSSRVGKLRKGQGAQHSSGSGYGAGSRAGKNVGLGGGAALGAGTRQIGSGS